MARGETPMSKPFNFNRSPEDEATYAKWRRGVVMFYGCIGLVAIVAVLVVHLANETVQMAGK
jgi:hypothetical protein